MLRERVRALMSWLRRPDIAIVVAACALVGVMYCANSDWGGDPYSPRGDGRYRPVLARGDGHMYYLMARSTVFDGDWRFDNDLARFGDPWNAKITAAGRKSMPHPIGPALVWAPVLATAQGLAWTLDQVGADIPLHGYTGFHQRIVFATSVLFAWLAILLAWRAARRWVGGRWGPALAAIAVLLGTSLTYYATYMPSYPHAMDAFLVAAFLHYWATTIGRRDVRRFAVLGSLLGAATLVRSQELALGIVVAIELGVELWEIVRRRPGARPLADAGRLVGLGALAVVIALALFSIQLYEWHVVYGGWGGLPQGARYTRLGHPLVLETLFSARNGWFATTPIAYLGAIGLALLPRRHRLLGAGLLVALVVQIYLCSTIYDWWGSSSFSQRRLTSMSYPLVIGLATLLVTGARLLARARVPRWGRHAIAIAALGWLVWWNLAQVIQLRGGKPANAELHACCDGVPAPLRWLAEPVHRAIGNPFALPASAIFAVRYRVPLTRWDQTVGAFPLVPNLDDLADGSYVTRAHAAWNLGGGPGIEPWLLDGWGASFAVAGGAPVGNARHVDESARALVPLLLPDGIRGRLWMLGPAHATIDWNGDQVADRDVPAQWTAIDFDVPASNVKVGMNTIEIDGQGVSVGKLELSFLPPD